MSTETETAPNPSLQAILSLSWQSLAYGVGVLGSQILIYLMLPILTRYMPKAEYGAVAVIMTLYAFLNTLTNAGLPAATFRFYHDPSGEQSQRLTLGTSQFLFFLFAAIPAAGIIAFPGPLSVFLLGSDQFALALELAAAFLIVDSLNFFGTIILRIQVRPLASSVQSMILIASETGMAIVFVTAYHMGVVGFWLGYLIGGFVGLVCMVWIVRKAIVFRLSWEKAWELTKFGLPLIPTTLSTTALRLADRYVIASLVGLEQVAIYDVGYKLGSIISLLISPFRAAWQPFALSIAQKPEAPRIYRDVLTYLAAGCAFLILAVVAFRGALLDFVAPAGYAGSEQVVAWVAVSQLFLALYLIVSIGPMIMKRTHELAWTAVSAGSLNVLLNYLLIPAMGILGAAIATFVSYLVLAVSTYFVAQRSFPLAIDWRRLVRLATASALVVLVIFAAEHLAVTASTGLILRIAGLCSFPVLLLFVRFVSPREAGKLIETGKSWANRRLVTSKNDEPY